MTLGAGNVAAGEASVHVIVTPMRRPWRAVTAAARLGRRLGGDEAVEFFLCGRSSAGEGLRDISRTLSLTRVVAVVAWVSPEAALTGRRALDERCRSAGADVWSAALEPLRTHGRWNGHAPFRATPSAVDDGGPVASLTCARVRPRRMVDFYLRSFPALARQSRRADSAMIAGLGFGGAVPLRDACTISFWPSSTDVGAFAFGGSAHDVVQQRSVGEDWMSQSLFTRFAIRDHAGTWAGTDPLAPNDPPGETEP